MKHESVIKQIISELHEPWMDETDKAMFDVQLMCAFGEKLDADIEAGIAKGFTVEQQLASVRSFFIAARK